MQNKWEKPKLVVLVRGMANESVLAICKTYTSPGNRNECNVNTPCPFGGSNPCFPSCCKPCPDGSLGLCVGYVPPGSGNYFCICKNHDLAIS